MSEKIHSHTDFKYISTPGYKQKTPHVNQQPLVQCGCVKAVLFPQTTATRPALSELLTRMPQDVNNEATVGTVGCS